MKKIAADKKILGLLIAGLFFVPLISHAGVIFEENFDSQPNWNVNREVEGGCDYPCSKAPSHSTMGTLQWNAFYIVPFSGSFAHSIASIQAPPTGTDHSGGGKAFIGYHQSSGNYGGNGSWGGNSTLQVTLPQDYPELYARFWVKTQSNWQWDTTGTSMAKMFRIEHWDRTPGTTFEYFSTGHTAPAWVWMWYYSPTYGVRKMNAYRCSPQSSDYYCPSNAYSSDGGDGNSPDAAIWPGTTYSDTPSKPGLWSDGNWHRYDVHIKINSAPGANDGVIEYRWDDNLIWQRNNLQWMSANTTDPANRNWNIVAIGGNTDYVFGSGDAEQWYAIDDVVVSTTPIPDNYVIGGGGGANSTPPAAPIGLRLQ